MRSRNIKPAFFENELLAELEPLTRLFFIGMWCAADREGRLEHRAKRLKVQILPYDEGFNPEAALAELEKLGFVACYAVGNNCYIQITNFTKHQRPHRKETESSIPEYVLGTPTNEQRAGVGHTHDTPTDGVGQGGDKPTLNQGALIPDILITDSLNDDSLIPPEPAKKKKTKKNDDSEFEEDFQMFYDSYPRKRDRKLAFTAYVRARRNGTTHETIMGGVFAYGNECELLQRDSNYIAYPATWLNGERWCDEYQTTVKVRNDNYGRMSKTDEVRDALAAVDRGEL